MTFYLCGSQHPISMDQWRTLQNQRTDVCDLDGDFSQSLTISFKDLSCRFEDYKLDSPLYLHEVRHATVSVFADSLLFPRACDDAVFWDSKISVTTDRLNRGPVVVPFVFKATEVAATRSTSAKTVYEDKGILVTIERDKEKTHYFSKPPIDKPTGELSNFYFEDLTLSTTVPNHVQITVPHSTCEKVGKVFSLIN